MAEKQEMSVEQLEAAIEQETAVKAKLEESLASDIEAQKEAEQRRDKLAYTALGKDNARSKKQLDEVETLLAKTAQRITSRQKAIAMSSEKIARLREQRAEAAHREGLRRYNEQLEVLLTKGADFESKLVDFLRGKAELETHLELLDKLSFAVFAHEQRPHRNILRALHWSLEQRLGIATVYRDADFKRNHRLPIDQIFARILKHGEQQESVSREPTTAPEAVDASDSGENGARKKASK